jgi:hypothetical protein
LKFSPKANGSSAKAPRRIRLWGIGWPVGMTVSGDSVEVVVVEAGTVVVVGASVVLVAGRVVVVAAVVSAAIPSTSTGLSFEDPNRRVSPKMAITAITPAANAVGHTSRLRSLAANGMANGSSDSPSAHSGLAGSLSSNLR